MSLGLLQAGLGDHCLELIPGAHVDGLRNQLAFTVINEAFGDSFHLKEIVYLSAGVEQHGIGNFLFRDEGLNFCGLLIGNGNDYESLIFVPVVERLQIGHLFAARWTPRGPEIYQHDLASEIPQMPGVALQVRKREVGLLSRSVGSLEFRERLGELRTVRLRLHVLVTANGSRLWRLAYRFGGKQKLLALGKYPGVSLGDARLARELARNGGAGSFIKRQSCRDREMAARKGARKDEIEKKGFIEILDFRF